MSKKLMSILVISFMLRSVLFAGEVVKDGREFYDEIAKFSSQCQQEKCEKPYSKTIIYHHLDSKIMDDNLRKILERVAHKQAQIWGDTILEGDYAAEGDTRLDQVANLYKDNELIGYLITYSEKAWFTADCSYDGLNDSTLLGCVPGRIVESSYVSLNFREYFYDEKTAATFKN